MGGRPMIPAADRWGPFAPDLDEPSSAPVSAPFA